MHFYNHNIEILWSYCRERKNTFNVYKNWCNYSLIMSQKCAWNALIFKIDIVLSMLYKTLY